MKTQRIWHYVDLSNEMEQEYKLLLQLATNYLLGLNSVRKMFDALQN